MKKVWHLSTCKTCRRILCELGGLEGFEHQNLRERHISPEDLDWLKSKTGSYESLFNRQSVKYKEMGLKDKSLSEDDYRRLILSHYSFLKRPVIVIGEEVFVGNAAKTVEAAKEKLEK